MSSAFLRISDAIVALLNQDPPVCEQTFQARERVFAESWAAAINVQFDGADSEDSVMHGAPIDWISTFSIECYAKSSSMGGDRAVDPLLVGVYERLAANATLNGLVADISVPRIVAEYDAQAQKTGWVRMTYQIEHRTSNNNLN